MTSDKPKKVATLTPGQVLREDAWKRDLTADGWTVEIKEG